jgi:P-type conjugative transfer ATPase TrbB
VEETTAAAQVVQGMPSGESMRDIAQERLKEGLRRDFGPVCMKALEDPKVIEIMLNADRSIWVDEFGSGMRHTGYTMPASQSMKLFQTLATMFNVVVNAQNPFLSGSFPLDGSRFQGEIPPISAAPTFAIRKMALSVFPLTQYLKDGMLTQAHYDAIINAVNERQNIVVVGGTGSGKTTFLNAVLDAVSVHTPEDRVLLMEDTGEIQCKSKNQIAKRTTMYATMEQLLVSALRYRPDRIIVGEVRGKEASTLLEAWNTGHPGGLATIHANSAALALRRIERLLAKSGEVNQEQTIAEAVNLVVFIKKEKGAIKGRKVKEVAVVKGYDIVSKQYQLEYI